jgi:hypothetical protein
MSPSRSAERENRKEPWPMSRGFCSQCLVDELDAVPATLGAGAQHRCQNLLRPSTVLGPIPAPHLAIDHGRTDRLFRRPVRRFHAGMTGEGEELVAMSIEMLREALVYPVGLRPCQEAIQSTLESSCRHRQTMAGEFAIVPTVSQVKSILEERLHLSRETHCSTAGDLQEVAAPPEKMRQALLVGRQMELVVGRPSIVPDRSGEVGAQDFLRNFESPAGSDQVGRRTLADEGPEPLKKSPDFPAGLVGVDRRAFSNDHQNGAICVLAARGGPQHDLRRTSSRKADPEGALEEASQLAVGQPQALDQMDRHGLGLWPDLACSSTQRIRGLEGVPPLDPTPTAFAPAHLDVEPTVDRPSRHFDLKLVLEFDELDVALAVGAGFRKRGPMDHLDRAWGLAEGLRPVLVARLSATLLRIGLRLPLGERSRLTLRRLLEALDDLPQLRDLFAEVGVLPPEPLVQLEQFVVGGALGLLSGHHSELSDRPVTNFTLYPLNKYLSCCN